MRKEEEEEEEQPEIEKFRFRYFSAIFVLFPGEGLGRRIPILFINFFYFGPEARNLFCSRPTGPQQPSQSHGNPAPGSLGGGSVSC